VLAVALLVIAIDASRATVSWRASRRYQSAALASNALHFAGDLAGSLAVLVGLLIARAGYPNGDSVAALFVAVLVLAAASRLMRSNIDVLMDRVPPDAEAAAHAAIAGLSPSVELRRLRMRHAGGRQFADVVIGVSPTDAVGQGHAAADAVEEALERALPGSDVVVHVEPLEDAGVRERAHAAALTVPGVREIHNLALVHLAGRLELSLHLKLPGDVTLEAAHDVAEQLERAILDSVPELDAVQTHLEPLTETAEAREERVDSEAVERIVRQATGRPPRELRFLRTEVGLVAFLTLGLDGGCRLEEAHAQASEIEELIRREQPEIADVIVHTEP
jgi:divalent metal cation (Fe/Co/Zn/Cd) transporter